MFSSRPSILLSLQNPHPYESISISLPSSSSRSSCSLSISVISSIASSQISHKTQFLKLRQFVPCPSMYDPKLTLLHSLIPFTLNPSTHSRICLNPPVRCPAHSCSFASIHAHFALICFDVNITERASFPSLPPRPDS